MFRGPHKHNFANILLFLFLFNLLYQANANTFIYAGCSPAKFPPNTPFQATLNSFLSFVATSASQTSYNILTNTSSPPGSDIYGLYQCQSDLSLPNCSSCIVSALDQLNEACPYAFAGSIQLDGCFIRYANEDFLGRLDTTQVYRKCSPSTNNDGDFVRDREDVLAVLQIGTGFHRSGMVNGYAQCLGDLSPGDCTTCLAQAVAQLNEACAEASAAEVFLAQCYARYWGSGYYLHPSPDYSDNVAGRTVAIIIGVLAGAILLVILLSCFKRACKAIIHQW